MTNPTPDPTSNPPRPPEGSVSSLGLRCAGCGELPPLIAGTAWPCPYFCEDCTQRRRAENYDPSVASMEDVPGKASIAN